ncbi:MAG: mannitol dehydrogenase family protein [Methylobacteriaceae bacterium]|nr:mannitol dehydrogenase family protein [Methylobacteriaceae bacterium]
MTNRLSAACLAALPEEVARPTYDRGKLDVGVVHLGVGAFHRAHQAVYTEAALAAGDRRWGILGASLRSADTRDALRPQEFLYTLAERDAAGERLQVIGALRDVMVAPEDPGRLLETMARASVKIVSLTVTEKGYCHDPATGALREDHPDILHDLANPARPRTAIGFLAEALARRRAARLSPFTVLTCDNLPSNGHTVQRVLARFAALRDADLGRFVADAVACPCTMVDRIVPATTAEDRERTAAALGALDAWPVATEPFTQWVIEDRFCQGRPDWSIYGAEFVADVAPYETMKLRLLNGAHSSLAYLGYLAGYATVAEAMSDPDLSAFVTALMTEDALPTLRVPAGADVQTYIEALLERFRNPALKHRTRQIAMDGSQKLPQRLLGTIRDRLAEGAPIARPALSIAAWMRYVTGIDEHGGPIDVSDPLRDDLRRRADAAGLDARRLTPALLDVAAIFGEDLPRDRRFAAAVESALGSLIRRGTRETLRGIVRSPG